jgi:adenosylmethionine-8-amino-7-oxononanoate aminotransferase
LTALWHPQANMADVSKSELVFLRGEGSYLYDESGHRYFDAPASLWYCNVGHGRRAIADAVAAQMCELESYSNFERLTTRPTLELAERVVDLAPIDNSKVFFTSGGSDAIETAAKLARRYWSAAGHPDKQSIVTRHLAYHGLHGFGTSITGLEPNREGLGDLLPNVQVPNNDLAALESVFATNAEAIAAFFAEPVMGTGGVIPPAEGYLEGAQALCRRYDVLFVADEVITGFGRTGKMFATELFGLEPDMIVLAKGITSGYMPLGGVVVGRRVWEPFFETGTSLVFRHGLTYSGHAAACAGAMANLDILEKEGLVDRVAALSPRLHQGARRLGAHPLVQEVRTGVGLLAGVQIVTPATARAVADQCLERGVLVRVITNGTLQLSPPFVTSEDDLTAAIDVVEAALDAVAS